MYCPRCGHQNQPDDRFCSNCGATLQRPESEEASSERRSIRERIGGLIGTTRSARLATAGTAIAIVVAIVAFLALKTDDEDRDQFTVTADAQCVGAKAQIGQAAQEAATGARSQALSRYAEAIVPIVTGWRVDFGRLEPGEHAADAARLNEALDHVVTQAGTLARLARNGERQQAIAQAARVDTATNEVENAIRALDLDDCARLQIGSPGGSRGG